MPLLNFWHLSNIDTRLVRKCFNYVHLSGTTETGGAGGAIAPPPPVFVAKIYKLKKLKAKVVNILKILTFSAFESNAYSFPTKSRAY